MKIVPVILAGGAGTRLWPLSRKSFPKQFAPVLQGDSLFQRSVQRFFGPDFAPPLILTSTDFRFIVSEQLAEIDIPPGAILLEPEGRNTAAPILAAALWMQQHHPDDLMLVAPSDHAIPDPDSFVRAVHAASPTAAKDRLVTFGITPTRPETGYGYIALSDPKNRGQIQPVRHFAEKPETAVAQRMVARGDHLWNAGIFLFSPASLIQAFQNHAPDIIPPVSQALSKAQPDLGFYRLDPESWAGVRDISIDHAIMEHADTISVMPYDGGWSDLGDWDCVSAQMTADTDGNTLAGTATALDCHSSLLRSEPDGPQLVGMGLNDMMVVAMPDAVLVAPRSHAQQVKQAVTKLQTKSAAQADRFNWDHRPWGQFETLATGPRFQVKRIVVKPGGTLSLQSHVHRAEHWIVVQGTARVTIGNDIQLVSENQSVYVPLGQKHRLENPGKMPMILIEVQTGCYLGEDDITRYEDVYDRGQVGVISG